MSAGKGRHRIRRRTSLIAAVASLFILFAIWMADDMLSSQGSKTVTQSFRDTIKVDAYPALPNALDPALVRTSAAYRILLHLVSPLARYNSKAQIEANLAESWEISPDFKVFRFLIRSDAKWSDGKIISAEDVAKSLARQSRLNRATHFDFSTMISAVAHDRTVEIRLKEANPHFLKAVVHPEFGVIRETEKEQLDFEDLKVSSGPYFLESFDRNELVLKRNPYYPSRPDGPSVVVLRSTPVENQLKSLVEGKVDFVVPGGPVSSDQHRALMKEKGLKAITPHIGYTFWLSVNPRAPSFRSKESRLWFTNFIHGLDLKFEHLQPIWTRANQLYLPDGFGRPTEAQLAATFQENQRKASSSPPAAIRMVVSETFLWTSEIVSALRAKGVEVSLRTYKNIHDYEAYAKSADFDVIQINNDFSTPDLLENLFVTFNPTRPLVFVGDDRSFEKQLKEAYSTFDKEKIYGISTEIALRLLAEGYVAPIGYFNLIYYAKESVDVSAWSKLQSDLGFWKVTVGKE